MENVKRELKIEIEHLGDAEGGEGKQILSS